MKVKSQCANSASEAPRSKLVPFGCLLIVLGVVIAPQLARMLATVPGGAVRLGLAVLTDSLRLGVFLGVAMLVIGLLRNGRMRREREGQP